MSDAGQYDHVYAGPDLEQVFAMAAAAKAGVYNRLILDDTAAAVPEEPPAGYDLETCSEKHSRMTAYQAQRIDHLEARIRQLEETIEQWSAGK